MKGLPKPDLCCGCGACADVCPAGAVVMRPDAEGFAHPAASGAACTDCGLCESVCPVLGPAAAGGTLSAYAVTNGSGEELSNSSSGGAFALLARAVLERGGAVCGAAIDSGMRVVHRFIESADELPALMGSKYVQSDAVGAYSKARSYLEAGREVLFCGTPCQTAALRAYLGRAYAGLTLCGVICHGVPSPLAWRRYLAHAARGKRPVAASFRDKRTGWRHYSVTVSTDGGEYSCPAASDPYMRAFLNDLDLRPCCYDCRFRGTARHADITLGDFWGAEKLMGPDDDRGVSLLLTHTQKGEQAAARIEGASVRRVSAGAALSFNAAALVSPKKPAERAAFMAELPTRDFAELVRKYARESGIEKLKRAVKRLIGR